MSSEDTFKNGDRVIYIPMHAEGNRLHSDCEWGIVSSVFGKRVFVKFDKQVNKFGWDLTTSQACCPESLEHGELNERE